MSVHNRRKSRAGFALENHVEKIFKDNNVKYTKHGITENKIKPDFIFPSIESYHNPDYPADKLTILGVKSTCKDRWRQVLSEAEKIKSKHLLTLEPGISRDQLNEMKSQILQLVVPAQIQPTYSAKERAWLINLSQFVKLVLSRQ